VFEPDDLKALVECAGKALEAEDRYLAETAASRGWVVEKRPRGIRANTNERHYQFVIWRELSASFRWRTETEREVSGSRGAFDLVFFNGGSDQVVGVAEIKVVWGQDCKYNEGDIQSIRGDIKKLAGAGFPGVMLILTGQYCSNRERYLSGLAENLRVEQPEITCRTFDVEPWPGPRTGDKPTEFLVIGFIVKPASATA
jgi:hypothetical protein